jgi:hypothetical protein
MKKRMTREDNLAKRMSKTVSGWGGGNNWDEEHTGKAMSDWGLCFGLIQIEDFFCLSWDCRDWCLMYWGKKRRIPVIKGVYEAANSPRKWGLMLKVGEIISKSWRSERGLGLC